MKFYIFKSYRTTINFLIVIGVLGALLGFITYFTEPNKDLIYLLLYPIIMAAIFILVWGIIFGLLLEFISNLSVFLNKSHKKKR